MNSFNSRYQQVAIPTEPASKGLFKNKSCQLPSEQNTCTKEGTLNIDISTYNLEAGKISPDKQSVDNTMVEPSSKLNTPDFYTLPVNCYFSYNTILNNFFLGNICWSGFSRNICIRQLSPK